LKRFLLHIILSIAPLLAFAQNLEETKAFADKQFLEENYHLALKAYKRILFFDKEAFKADCYPRIAHCYFKTEDFSKSLFYYDLSLSFTSNDSLRNEYIFKRVILYLLQHQLLFALQEVLSINEQQSRYFTAKKDYYLGVIHFQNNDFEKAKLHFKQCAENSTTADTLRIEEMFEQAKLDKPNPRTAKILSMFVPGSGQIYAGDIKNALNSILLTGGFATIFILTYTKLSPLDAIISVLPWFQRYYMGGVSKAEQIAYTKKEKKRQALFADILNYLEINKCF
jgi:hypothetical protein